MNKLVHARFCGAVEAERKRQEEKHGVACFEIPDSTDSPQGRETWETIARNSCNRAFKEGRLTNAHILDEEASEALTAAAKGDVEGLKQELVQVAAVCLAWLEAIEKREAPKRRINIGDRFKQVDPSSCLYGRILQVVRFHPARNEYECRWENGVGTAIITSVNWLDDNTMGYLDASNTPCLKRVPQGVDAAPERVLKTGDRLRHVYPNHTCFGWTLEVGEFDEEQKKFHCTWITGPIVGVECWIRNSLNMNGSSELAFERLPPKLEDFKSGDKVRVKVTGLEGEVYGNHLVSENSILVKHRNRTVTWYFRDQIERV